MSRILVVDNFDSFVFNIVQYLARLGAEVDVVRAGSPLPAPLSSYAGVVLSPGPGAPGDAAGSLVVLREAVSLRLPLLGVCLGHQVLAEAFGASVCRAPELVHGGVSSLDHDGEGVFAGLPQGFSVTRYHSLAVLESSLPPELVVSARTVSGVVMGLRHSTLPFEGVQFHPESVLTEYGYRMLASWLVRCGLLGAPAVAESFPPARLSSTAQPS